MFSFRSSILFLLFFLLSLVVSSPSYSLPHLLLDLDSRRVLSHNEAFDLWHPASLTKLMTAYVIFDALESGEILGDSPVYFSGVARRQPPGRIGYGANEVVSVDDALKILIIRSANDIAVALSEKLSGSESAFVVRMNRVALSLGMRDTHFVNSHGLHDSRQVTTARDLGLLLLALHKNHPRHMILFRASGVRAQFGGSGNLYIRTFESRNLLLTHYRGADGFKTGYVCASGYNLAASATRSDRRLAAIVLGRNSSVERASDAARLLTLGFDELPPYVGEDIDDFRISNHPRRATPRNMRSRVCSSTGRARRANAQKNPTSSPYLSDRRHSPLILNTVLQRIESPALRHPFE